MNTKHNFTFLLEGSINLSYHPGTSALKMAIDDLDRLDYARGLSGKFTMAAGLFGAPTGAMWLALYNFSDLRTRERLGRIYACGSVLSPSVDEVTAMVVESGEPTHLVIVSSDDVYDNDRNEKALEKFLKSNPQSTLDAVIIGDSGKGFERMLCRFKASFPQQVGAINTHAFGNISDHLLSGIVDSRLEKPAPKNNATLAPKK